MDGRTARRKYFLCEVLDLKKATINISYNEEKLNAMKLYLEQKGTCLDNEVIKMLDALFNKTVPSGVRDFISMKSEGYAPTSKKEIKNNG